MARLALQFPMSLAIYPDYEQAQRAVDYLSDHEFPVQNCMIVGTDLKQVERVTGRLTRGKVAMGGAASGMWFGALIGFLMTTFTPGATWSMFLTAVLLGAFFGIVWAGMGYALTRGRRDFTSVSQVVATRYEVLVEHAQLTAAKELLTSAGSAERAGVFAAAGQQGPVSFAGSPQGPAGPGHGWPPPAAAQSAGGHETGGAGHPQPAPPTPSVTASAPSPGPAEPAGAPDQPSTAAAPYRTYGEAMDAQKRAEEQRRQ